MAGGDGGRVEIAKANRLGRSHLQCAAYPRLDPAHHRLLTKTWQKFVEAGEAKGMSSEQLKGLYEENPAGESVVAWIEHEGVWVGAISAIATVIRRPDGKRLKSFQIGDFMVDPEWQGQGLGRMLLAALTEFLASCAEPVFTFPNARSIGLFLKAGYSELRRIPSLLYPLFLSVPLGAMIYRDRISVRDVALEEGKVVTDELMEFPRRSAMIDKSGAFIEWRYGLVRNIKDYTFSVVEDQSEGAIGLFVWSVHRYKGIGVQVVVDSLWTNRSSMAPDLIAGRGLSKGAVIGVTYEDPLEKQSGPHLAVSVPRRYEPRPARLLVPPGDSSSEALFRSCAFMTGDWMGF